MKLMNTSALRCLEIVFIAISGATSACGPAQISAPLDPDRIRFHEIASGLQHPDFVTSAADGSGRLFIIEQRGDIRVLRDGKLLSQPFLDIHKDVRIDEQESQEPGLLALAFHPSYRTNGYFYVAYTAPNPADSAGDVRTLKRFSVSSNPDVADHGSGTTLLTIDHPLSEHHNGGTLAFDPHGYLYWSVGDGGIDGDPTNNGQNRAVLLGKILRLDVDSAFPYAIPQTNPFYSRVADPGVRPEIWAYGLRNPWRISFDRKTGDLYIADVGEDRWEEIDFQSAGDAGGENYGWRQMEGMHCYEPASGCDAAQATVLPVVEYSHSDGCAVIGGYVYRGSAYPAFEGYYFYGDYCSGRLHALRNEAGTGWVTTPLGQKPHVFSSFGEDEQGEIYVADGAAGKVYQLRYRA